MRFSLLSAVAVFTALVSVHASADSMAIGYSKTYSFDKSDCKVKFTPFATFDEGQARRDFCAELKKNESATSADKDRQVENVRDDAWYEKHSSFIRWTVIRARSEGMPEECRYFFCDMHGGWATKREADNEWVITLPRSKGAPEDCKFSYCNQVYTESDTRPAINTDYIGSGLER